MVYKSSYKLSSAGRVAESILAFVLIVIMLRINVSVFISLDLGTKLLNNRNK